MCKNRTSENNIVNSSLWPVQWKIFVDNQHIGCIIVHVVRKKSCTWMFLTVLFSGLTPELVSVVQYKHLMLVGSFRGQCTCYQLCMWVQGIFIQLWYFIWEYPPSVKAKSICMEQWVFAIVIKLCILCIFVLKNRTYMHM